VHLLIPQSLPVPEWLTFGFAIFVVIVAGSLLLTLRSAVITRRSGPAVGIAAGLVLWLALTGILAVGGFFTPMDVKPPRFALGVAPAMVAVFALLAFRRTRDFLLAVPASKMVAFQVFRVPVELFLWALAAHGIVPTAMTFEGHNGDILTGLTAPFVAYFCLIRKTWPRWIVLAWNLMGIALLVNVVGIAIRTAQVTGKIAPGDVYNMAPFLFPFMWLPYFLVPLALFGHLASLLQWKQSITASEHGKEH
jgi:hypothetical protein